MTAADVAALDAREQLEHLRAALARSGVRAPEVVLPQDRDVLAGRMRLHYLDWGDPGGSTVLFLHGGGLTAHTWDVVCMALRDRCRCLALDLRGHGDSEWSPNLDYGIPAHVADVENFVEKLGLTRFVLVGMSLGGLSAIGYAIRHSERLAGLVVVDVSPAARMPGSDRIRRFMAQPAEFDSIDEFVSRAMEFNPRRDRALLRRSLLHNLRRLPNGKWTWKYDRRHRERDDPDRGGRDRERLWAEIGGIGCPTLVVRGGQSDVLSDEAAAELAERIAGGRWVAVPEAGHTVQGDNPRGLLEHLQPFLAEVSAA